MNDEMTLLQKLTIAQAVIKAPSFDNEVDYTAKGRRVHYKYASLKACMDAVDEAFAPWGLAVWHDVKCIEDGSLFVITKVSDGKEVVERCPFPVKLNGTSQDNGSEFTYAKRYSLCAALGIVADDDDDGQKASTVDRGQVPKAGEDAELRKAKGRLATAIQGYADRHNMDAAVLKGGIVKRPDYTANASNPDYFNEVAEEFENE